MTAWPLAGLEVIDATRGVAGPFCGKLLADAGATVTSVRLPPPSGESQAEPPAEFERFFARSKRTSTLDVHALLAGADVFLCSDRHEQLASLGLDCASVLERHPNLISVCITPFGNAGPYAAFASDDLVLSALSGLTDCTPGFPDRQEHEGEAPVQSQAPLAEIGAGLVSAIAVFGTLQKRLRSDDHPRHIELSCHEANVWLMVSEWGIAAYGGTAPGRRRKSRSLEPNCYLRCRDGYIVVVATLDKHWRALVEVMGNPEWASDPRFADVPGRAENAAALHDVLSGWASTAAGHSFMEAAQERGIPCTCYLDLTEVVTSEQVRAIGSLDDVFPADPIVFGGSRRGGFPDAPAPQVHGRKTALPLEGVRVVDLGQMVAGPMAGQYLAALGAEVIVVESRTHLPSRHFGPFAGEPTYDASSNFNHCNRGKASVTIDLSSDEGRSVLGELISTSDVVLENFSRKAAAKLGLEYDELAAKRDGLIVGSISAFGRSGPQRDYVSHHGGVTALSGLASLIRDDDGEPRLVGAIYPDVLTGTYMALAVQQALALRDQTGEGRHIEVNMLDVLLTCMAGFVPGALEGRTGWPERCRFLESAEPGRFLAVAVDAVEHANGVGAHTRSETMVSLQSAGCRAGAVLDMLEVMDDPQLRGNDFVLELDHPVAGRKPLPAVPWFYDGERPWLGVAPLLGEHTTEVLELIGIESARVDALRSEGVLN